MLPASWETGPPDFVGVGVQRAGTTWWHAAIEAHPQVHRVPFAPKERHFFDAFHTRPFTDEDVRAYHALFPRPPGTLAGEWTPAYLYHHWTPPLLAQAAPQARVLVLLRDPVDRYVSAISGDERHHRRSPRRASEAFERGLYHAQLARLLRYVDRSRLLVLQYERCHASPEEMLRQTYVFLGIAPNVVPDVLHVPTNVGRTAPVKLPDGLARAVREAYRPDAEALFTDFPELDPRLWTSLGLS